MTSQQTDTDADSGTQGPGSGFEATASVRAHFKSEEWAILERRARELAERPHGDQAETSGMVQVLMFNLGSETYAVPAEYVREVRPLERLTPVPCTPDFVIGVVNLRGNILSLIDIRKFLGVPQEGIADLMHIIVVEAAGLDVGVMASGVNDVNWLLEADLAEPPATVGGISAEYIKGVTPEAVILLDPEALLGDERLIVNEAVP